MIPVRRLGLCLLLTVLLCWSAGAGAGFRERLHHKVAAATTTEDVKAEVRFGREIAARVLGRHAIQAAPGLNRYLNLIGTALATQAGRPELSFHFAVLDSDQVNAWSAPGGYIFVTRGALARMQDEAELAAVLAHEIAHVANRHIVKALDLRARDSSGTGGLSRLMSLGADTARVAFTQAVDRAVSILFEQGYRQEDELDADRSATVLLAAGGYDPAALRRYLHRLGQAEEAPEDYQTHPATPRRLHALDMLLQQEGLGALDARRATDRFKRYVETLR